MANLTAVSNRWQPRASVRGGKPTPCYGCACCWAQFNVAIIAIILQFLYFALFEKRTLTGLCAFITCALISWVVKSNFLGLRTINLFLFTDRGREHQTAQLLRHAYARRVEPCHKDTAARRYAPGAPGASLWSPSQCICCESLKNPSKV